MVGLIATCLAVGPVHAGFQTFTTADGLAQDLVRSILEDDEGSFWFGTYLGGVSRFDGVTWVTYDSLNSELAGNNVFDLHQDPAGAVWAGTNVGVARFDGSGWQTFGPSDGLPIVVVPQIEEDGSGALWVRGTAEDGVARFAGSAWTHFTQADGLGSDTVNEIYIDDAGTPWFATAGGGVSRYEGGTWITYTTADGLASDKVTNLIQTEAGDFWFATEAPTAVSHFDGQNWTTYTQLDGIAGTVLAVFEDRNGNIWVGTAAGVNVFDGTSWVTYDVGSGLADNQVDRITEDPRGFVWLGSEVGREGITRYDGKAFEAFSTQDGLGSNNVTQFLLDRTGNLWISSAGGGVTRFDGVTFRRFGPLDGVAGVLVQALAVDSSGALWVGTATGLNRFDGSTWDLFTTASGLPSNDVSAVLERSNGEIWAGTAAGLATWDGNSWTTVPVFASRVWSVFESAEGHIWAATGGLGVWRFDGVGWTTFAGNILPSNNVFAVSQDSLGNIWVGTVAGAARFDGVVWQKFSTNDGLPTNQVNALLKSRDGHMWFGTENGVSRYDGQAFVTFGESDGLANRVVKTIFEDDDGLLWFGTLSGVSRFDRQRFVTFGEGNGLSGPRVFGIAQDQDDRFWFGTQLGQNAVTRHEPDRVPPRAVIVPAPPGLSPSRDITLTYVAAFGENRIEFETVFDGVRRPWGGLNFFQQQGVQDGQHSFAVRARDQFGNAEPTPRTASFEIDATQPQPQITFPGAGAVLKDVVDITGTTDDLRFNDARVLARPVGAPSWQPPDAVLLYADTIPVVDGALTRWDTNGFAEGDYEVTAFVTDTLGLIGTSGAIRVMVDNLFPFFDQTTPARVSAASGGNVFTTNSEVKLFFPPNAFTQDAQVTITRPPGVDVPDSLGPGVVRVTPAFDVNWIGAALRKPATLQMNYIGATLPPGAPIAVYAAGDSTTWSRLGGTVDPNQSIIGTTINGTGRYALFAETNGSPSSGRFLGNVTLAPRVFSPRGNFSETRVAIGFSIGEAAPVTVKIYNRAGRHVSTVAQTQIFAPGNNLVYWDGMDREGQPATEGIYIITVEALDEKQTKTLAVVK